MGEIARPGGGLDGPAWPSTSLQERTRGRKICQAGRPWFVVLVKG